MYFLDKAILAWFTFSVISILLYTFFNISVWVNLQDGQLLRHMLIGMFHFLGLISLPVWVFAKADMNIEI
jgi:hypothetical protein